MLNKTSAMAGIMKIQARRLGEKPCKKLAIDTEIWTLIALKLVFQIK